MSRQNFAVVLALVLASVIFFSGSRFLNVSRLTLYVLASAEKKFSMAWEDDLLRLKKAKALHAGFDDLREIKMISTSKKLKNITTKYPMTLKTTPNGKYNLEVFIDQIDDGGVVVQYDLIEIKSGNTVWELARTFPHKF